MHIAEALCGLGEVTHQNGIAADLGLREHDSGAQARSLLCPLLRPGSTAVEPDARRATGAMFVRPVRTAGDTEPADGLGFKPLSEIDLAGQLFRATADDTPPGDRDLTAIRAPGPGRRSRGARAGSARPEPCAFGRRTRGTQARPRRAEPAARTGDRSRSGRRKSALNRPPRTHTPTRADRRDTHGRRSPAGNQGRRRFPGGPVFAGHGPVIPCRHPCRRSVGTRDVAG